MKIPKGWKLVPIEPTKEMIEAGNDALDNCKDSSWSSDANGNSYQFETINSDAPALIYAAMIEAAPDSTKRGAG